MQDDFQLTRHESGSINLLQPKDMDNVGWLPNYQSTFQTNGTEATVHEIVRRGV
ncbi:MAG: hypothetical protein LIP77_05820 [Planctomycetes bacterium]|nr:hypothetical protein [Planctomycetota bacterium]